MSARTRRSGSRAWLAAALLAAMPFAAGAARAEVELEARVDRTTLAVGEAVTLEVHVRGATGGIGEPDLGVPPGVEVLGSSRSQNFSWVNGRSSSETVFQYQISPTSAGRFPLGPIRVKVGQQVYESPAIELVVSAAPTRIGSEGEGPASLLVDVSPRQPYVGQPVLVRVRLVQRTALAEDPQYTPPNTPGFWAERFRDPESYYADEGNRRVLVTETRARLYPLTTGRARVGEASAALALPTGSGSRDPWAWLGGAVPRREVTVKSVPVDVGVRALPPGAPAGFDGAVGDLHASWSADRDRTAQDVPFTVRLELRGVGNLPLVHTPAFDADGVEIFPATVEDSLGTPGELAPGRRRFQWTVLARRTGTLEVPAPRFAWFDPASETYRVVNVLPISIEIGPPLFAGDTGGDAFPAEFATRPLDPGAHGPAPWGWGLAGLALGASVAGLRASRRAPADAAERATQREWLRAVGLARGRDFWQAADRACEWLASRGAPVAALRRDIDAARYGGAAADSGKLRPRIVEQLGRALPPPPAPWPAVIAAVVLAAAAVGVFLFSGPRAGAPSDIALARRADEAARAGNVEGAVPIWEQLWRRGDRAAGLAARLAWASIRRGEVGQAAAWTLRGDEYDARDPALEWVREQVREGGGLVGAGAPRLPVRDLEWAIAALVAGVAAGALWPRRGPTAGAAALCAALAFAPEAERMLTRASPRAVVAKPVRLELAGFDLEPGQVVEVRDAGPDSARVVVTRDLDGMVPRDALVLVEESR